MSSSESPRSAPVSPVASPLLRVLRSTLWTVLALGLLVISALGIAAAYLGGSVSAAATPIAGCLALVAILRVIPSTGWARLAVGHGVLAIALVYLVVDEAEVHRPLTLNEVAPGFAGAEQSYDVLMRYGKFHPLGKDFRSPASNQLLRGPGAMKPKDPNWKTWVTQNRAELERNWVQLEPVRAWWSELNAFDRIGDLTPPRIDAEILAFAPMRTFSQHACAIASLRAIDGQGDAAMATLLPVIAVCRKLEPSSRTLVRSMMAIAAQKLALETAAFVLEHATVSSATREQLVTALTGGFGGEKGARHLVRMEYAWGHVGLTPEILKFIMADDTSAWIRRGLVPLGPLAFNSRRTINLYSTLMTELENCAARRAPDELAQEHKRFFQQEGRAGFKNLAGSLALGWTTPEFKKVVETYWVVEDLRTTLGQRLTTTAD